MSANPRYICIEGGMGAGKTTLARGLARSFGGEGIVEESGKHPFIEDFYASPDIYALETEIAFVLVHYHQLVREVGKGTFAGTVVSDFLLERDRIFARLTLKREEDRRLFETVYTGIRQRIPTPHLVVFLRAPVDFLIERMRQRGRAYEERVSREYVASVSAALERFFLKEYSGKKLVFDAPDLDSSTNPDYLSVVSNEVLRALESEGE